MTFGEAMVALEQGKRVRCKKWKISDYIFMNSDKDIIDQLGHYRNSILFDSMKEEWEECNWKYVSEETKTMIQVGCPYCFTFTYREVSDTQFKYCPHCGAKVVK